ncbi:hypothetical protein ACVWZ3_008543 [Bradyrhizobium sp. i1.3.6]
MRRDSMARPRISARCGFKAGTAAMISSASALIM